MRTERRAEAWERWLTFRCTGCGNCCRETVILITDDDVRRITDGTGRRTADFLRFASMDEIALERGSPWWVRFTNGRAVMALRWHDDESCIFLEDDNRCGVYADRPVVCRAHPFDVKLSRNGGVERVRLSRVVECEYANDGKQTRRALAAAQRWNQRQADTYLEKVAAWNERLSGERSPAEFLRFLSLPPT